VVAMILMTQKYKVTSGTLFSIVRAIGDKLASGGVWAKEEIAKGFESLGSGLNKLGQSIGSRNKASPFDVGA
jgi:hypothetical protein